MTAALIEAINSGAVTPARFWLAYAFAFLVIGLAVTR